NSNSEPSQSARDNFGQPGLLHQNNFTQDRLRQRSQLQQQGFGRQPGQFDSPDLLGRTDQQNYLRQQGQSQQDMFGQQPFQESGRRLIDGNPQGRFDQRPNRVGQNEIGQVSSGQGQSSQEPAAARQT